MSSSAYEWPVLVALKHPVGLSQHWFSKFLLQEWFRESHSKLMAWSPTCELHSPHLGCGLELILAVYREVHGHSFVRTLLPRARMREGVKQSVFSVCLSVRPSGEKF